MLNILLNCNNDFFFQLKSKWLNISSGFGDLVFGPCTLLAAHERNCVRKMKTVAIVKIRDI